MKSKFIRLIAMVILIIFQINQSRTQIPQNGLLAFWPLNGNANDSAAFKLNGTRSGVKDTLGHQGFRNTAAFFNGNAVVELGCNVNTLSTPQISISGWLKYDENQKSHQHILRNRFYGYAYHIENEKAGISFHTNGSNNPKFLYSTRKLSDLRWHHVVICINYDSAIIYVDNKRDSAIPNKGNLYYTTKCMALGRDPKETTFAYTGFADDIAVYDHCLSQKQIDSLYNDGIYKEYNTVKSSHKNLASIKIDVPNSVISINSSHKITKIQLFDLGGKLISCNMPNSETSQKLDYTGIKPAIYFIIIQFSNGITYNEKIVLNQN